MSGDDHFIRPDNDQDHNVLLPCPFCGSHARRHDIEGREDIDNAGASYIECSKCGACTQLHFERKENLIDSWNSRIKEPAEDEAARLRFDLRACRGRAEIDQRNLRHWREECGKLHARLAKARADLQAWEITAKRIEEAERPKDVECQTCEGSGEIFSGVGGPDDPERCHVCTGTGSIQRYFDDGSCIRCGSAPRNASGLCATCLDEDVVRAGEIFNEPPKPAGRYVTVAFEPTSAMTEAAHKASLGCNETMSPDFPDLNAKIWRAMIMAGVAEQSGAGAPETSVRCGAPADPIDVIREAARLFELIRVVLIHQLDEPARSAFWKAVEGRNKMQAFMGSALSSKDGTGGAA